MCNCSILKMRKLSSKHGKVPKTTQSSSYRSSSGPKLVYKDSSTERVVETEVQPDPEQECPQVSPGLNLWDCFLIYKFMGGFRWRSGLCLTTSWQQRKGSRMEQEEIKPRTPSYPHFLE